MARVLRTELIDLDRHLHREPRQRPSRHARQPRSRPLVGICRAARRRQRRHGRHAPGRRRRRARLPICRAVLVRSRRREIRRAEQRHPRGARTDHRGDRRRCAVRSGLARACGRGVGPLRLRLRRRPRAAAVGRAETRLARRDQRIAHKGHRPAGSRKCAARVRTRRHLVAARRERRLPAGRLRARRLVRQPARPEGGHAAESGAARVASARARVRRARLLPAGHGRAPPGRAGAPAEALLPSLVVLARHQPRDVVPPGRLRHGRAGARESAARGRAPGWRRAGSSRRQGAAHRAQPGVAFAAPQRRARVRARALALLLRRRRPTALERAEPALENLGGV